MDPYYLLLTAVSLASIYGLLALGISPYREHPIARPQG